MNRKKRASQRMEFSGVRPKERRGAMIVLIAVSLIVFLVAVAFSVDIAYVQLARAELRAATDAASRAGAESLSREQDMAAARQTAKDLAAENLVAGEPLLLEDDDIVPGNSVCRESGVWEFVANATPVNSFRVTGKRTNDSASGEVPLFFGRIFGVEGWQLTMHSTAVRLDRDICLVVDRSSSMKLDLATTAETMSTSDPRFSQPPDPTDSRWAALAVAVDEFIDTLATISDTETLALASYASDGIWCNVVNTASEINQPLTDDHMLVSNAMQEISARVFNGMTDIGAGIDEGVAVLTESSEARPYALKTIVLFTDGHCTAGRLPVLAAEDAAGEDIVIHAVTFGNGANQPDMQAVAEATGGKHYHATDAQALSDVFREIALSLAVTLVE